MNFLKLKEREKYLSDLGSKLKSLDEDLKLGSCKLGSILESIAAYQKRKIEKGMISAKFPIQESGFPSVPTLKRDIEITYKETKAYEAKAKKALEKLKSGNYSSSEQYTLERGFIHAQSSIFEPFIKPVRTSKERKDFIKFDIKEEDGWFEVIKQRQYADGLRKTMLPCVFIDNSDELGAIGASIVGGILFPPLLLAYPAMLVLKSTKQQKKTFLIGDVVRYVKNRKKSKQEKEIVGESEVIHIEKLRYFHPLTDGMFDRSVLVHKQGSKIDIICDDYKLKGTLEKAVDINKKLCSLFEVLTYAPTVNDGNDNPNYQTIKTTIPNDLFSGYKKDEILKFLMSIKETGETEVSRELYKLNKKEIKDLESLLKEEDKEIVVPKSVYVDKFGTLYPFPLLWVNSKGNCLPQSRFPQIIELGLDYLIKGKSGIPLAQFTQNLDDLNEVMNGFHSWEYHGEQFNNFQPAKILRKLSRGYVFVSRKQFSLREPKIVQSKINAFPSSISELKQNAYQDLQKLSKSNLHFDKVMKGINIITTYGGEPYGNIKKMFDLRAKIDKQIQLIEIRMKEGDLSKDSIIEDFNKVSRLRKQLEENYSKPVFNLANQIKDSLHEKKQN